MTMTDTYTKQFFAMRYWLLGRNYFLALDALEYASKLHTGKRKDGKTKEYFHQLSIGRYVKSIVTSGVLLLGQIFVNASKIGATKAVASSDS
jgi:hypothetical protein